MGRMGPNGDKLTGPLAARCSPVARKSPSPQPPREGEGVFSFQCNSQYNPKYNPHTGQKSAITEFRTSWGGLISRLLSPLTP
jgi:hypothetical protein